MFCDTLQSLRLQSLMTSVTGQILDYLALSQTAKDSLRISQLLHLLSFRSDFCLVHGCVLQHSVILCWLVHLSDDVVLVEIEDKQKTHRLPVTQAGSWLLSLFCGGK